MIGGLIAVIVAVGTARIAALDAGESLRHAQWQTQYRIDAPAVGVLLAAVRRYHPALFARLSHQRSVLCALALAGFGWLATGTEDTIRYGIGLCIAWASSAALVLAAADARVPSRLVPLARPLGALGLIAYSVYVWHPSAGQPAGVIVQAFGWTDPLAIVLARIGGAILVGALIYRLVEQPFLRLRDRPSMSKAPIQIMRSDCKRAI